LSNPRSRPAVEALLREADVLIESSAPDPLEPLGEHFHVSRLVELRISPFPATGPYARYRSNAFSDEALAGLSILNGEPGREPLARSGKIAPYQAGAQGFLGALAALRARERTGRGQRVEVSHFEALVGAHQHGLAMWSHAGHRLVREGNRQPGFWHPSGIYPCRDGHVYLALTSQAMRDRFFAAMDLPEILLDPRFRDDLALSRHKAEFDAQLCPWLLEHSQADLVALGQAAGAAVGPVTPMLELTRDLALEEREFWQGVAGAPGLLRPGRPFRLDTSAAPGAPRATPPRAIPVLADGPLQGIRILDLTRIWAGPLAARQLADLGADVVLVESPDARGGGRVEPELAARSHLFPGDDPGEEPWNRLGSFNDLMRNRRGITLDLKRPEARRVFEALLTQVDVVIENFRPRVMAGLGFDFETLQSHNPSLCHVAISGFGDSGGRRDWAAYGPMLEAAAGHSLGMGYRDSGPYRAGVSWADPLSGVLAAAGTLLALQERDSDPDRRGRRVEISIFEASL
ncbi:MAG: CoA transferase, partial [Myxococcota bacterium]